MWLSNTPEQADAGNTTGGTNLGHGRPDARDVGGVPPLPLRFQPARGVFRLEMEPFYYFERIIELGGSGDPFEIRGLETGSSRAAAWDARFHGIIRPARPPLLKF
ncbi:hypothetical protein BHE90_013998 [Fusarium euwallaceae]|uniref:Uncharacterized protein n=2 Tax=Fusarium solani species complex TaxID=232080 RepID=A0A430L7E3_9HYPO|nr:hypothetical protein CEP51_007711 [Fusarium floridanum]RTE71590.1 hypothetical protein BHE90_013998 [Fusarium euwallaceae]